MTPPRKVLFAYDGTSGAKRALDDLERNRPGLPNDIQVLVLCIADVWTAARFASFGPYGLDAAPMMNTQLRTIQEVERTALKDARKVALKALEELHADHPGWEVTAESCVDAPAWGIISRAEEWKADFIVMGSHGRSAAGRLVLGSVSQTVVREAACTVRVVHGRPSRRNEPVCLIVGFDGSPDAEAAVQAVAERVWPANSTVRLVTALGDPLCTAIPTLRWIAAHDDQKSTWTRRMIEDPVQRLRAAGLFVTPVVKRGDPRKILVGEAKRWDADSLFVGARGLRGINRFLLGSVSTAVAMRASCPVEVVRLRENGISRMPVGKRTGAQPAAAGVK